MNHKTPPPISCGGRWPSPYLQYVLLVGMSIVVVQQERALGCCFGFTFSFSQEELMEILFKVKSQRLNELMHNTAFQSAKPLTHSHSDLLLLLRQAERRQDGHDVSGDSVVQPICSVGWLHQTGGDEVFFSGYNLLRKTVESRGVNSSLLMHFHCSQQGGGKSIETPVAMSALCHL